MLEAIRAFGDRLADRWRPFGEYAGKRLGVFKVIAEKRLEYLIFIGSNIFFGALGLWAPPLLAWVYGSSDPKTEYANALAGGTGYTFALACVATALTYLIKEYRRNEESDFKDIKITGALFATFLMVLMAILFGGQIKGTSASISAGLHPHATLFQNLLTFLSVVVASYLFCLEQIDEFPDIFTDLKDRSRPKLRKAMDTVSDPEYKV